MINNYSNLELFFTPFTGGGDEASRDDGRRFKSICIAALSSLNSAQRQMQQVCDDSRSIFTVIE